MGVNHQRRSQLILGGGWVAAVVCFILSSRLGGAWKWAFIGLGVVILASLWRRAKTVRALADAERPSVPSGHWTVTLEQPGSRRIEVIRELRHYLNVNLDTGMTLVRTAPCVVARDVGEDFARSLAKALRDLDADVELTTAGVEPTR